MEDTSTETIIVGGGVAGMTCALKLRDAGRPYTMLTRNIGGRIKYIKEFDMNFGADHYTKSNRHSHEVLQPAGPMLLNQFDIEYHMTLGSGYGIVSPTAFAAFEQLRRFSRYLKNKFAPRYEIFKLNCETMEVSEALSKDPFIRELYETPATEVIKQLKIEKAARLVVSQIVHACTGTPIAGLNGLDYMMFALCIVDSVKLFTFDAEETRSELEFGGGNVSITCVDSIERNENGWIANTANGSYSAKNLVIATQAEEAKRLLSKTTGSFETPEGSELYVYNVRGTIKPEYEKKQLHVFDENTPMVNVSERPNKTWRVTTSTDIDLGVIFDEHEIVRQQNWENAVYSSPTRNGGKRAHLSQSLGDGLFRIGDYNVLGLESAAISGVFAANSILNR